MAKTKTGKKKVYIKEHLRNRKKIKQHYRSTNN